MIAVRLRGDHGFCYYCRMAKRRSVSGTRAAMYELMLPALGHSMGKCCEPCKKQALDMWSTLAMLPADRPSGRVGSGAVRGLQPVGRKARPAVKMSTRKAKVRA